MDPTDDRRPIETGTDDLLGERIGGVAVLTFNRPDRRNALSEGIYQGFATALPTVATDPDVRVVMVTGADGAFCSGGDVKDMNERHQGQETNRSGLPEDAVCGLRVRQRAVSLALRQLPKPVVAALPGPAAGAGLSIALAADLRLAAERAILVTAFSSIGASGDFGGSWFLTRLVGPAKAKELYWLSPRLSAIEAAELGLVNRILPDEGFAEAAIEFCQDLATRPPVALRFMKENVERAEVADLATCLDAEATAMIRTMGTDDHREAAAAFVEKRQPTFRGR